MESKNKWDKEDFDSFIFNIILIIFTLLGAYVV